MGLLTFTLFASKSRSSFYRFFKGRFHCVFVFIFGCRIVAFCFCSEYLPCFFFASWPWTKTRRNAHPETLTAKAKLRLRQPLVSLFSPAVSPRFLVQCFRKDRGSLVHCGGLYQSNCIFDSFQAHRAAHLHDVCMTFFSFLFEDLFHLRDSNFLTCLALFCFFPDCVLGQVSHDCRRHLQLCDHLHVGTWLFCYCNWLRHKRASARYRITLLFQIIPELLNL